jgi:hypothetical protein
VSSLNTRLNSLEARQGDGRVYAVRYLETFGDAPPACLVRLCGDDAVMLLSEFEVRYRERGAVVEVAYTEARDVFA